MGVIVGVTLCVGVLVGVSEIVGVNVGVGVGVGVPVGVLDGLGAQVDCVVIVNPVNTESPDKLVTKPSNTTS